jgi:hypothetical protein
VYCFLITCIVCLYVVVWSVVNDHSWSTLSLKIRKVLSSSMLGLKASPCYIPFCPITTCILSILYLLFLLALCDGTYDKV